MHQGPGGGHADHRIGRLQLGSQFWSAAFAPLANRPRAYAAMARTRISGSSKACVIAARREPPRGPSTPRQTGPRDGPRDSDHPAPRPRRRRDARLGTQLGQQRLARRTRLGTLERFDQGRSRGIAHRGHGRKRFVHQLLLPWHNTPDKMGTNLAGSGSNSISPLSAANCTRGFSAFKA